MQVVDPLEQQVDHFCEVIRGRADPAVTVRDGLSNLKVVAAIGEAARSGGTVLI